MKLYNILPVLVIICVGQLKAQTTITSQVFPNVGDTLVFAVDNDPAIQITDSGGGQIWDYSDLVGDLFFQQIFETPDSGAGSSFFPEASLLTRVTQGVESYWKVSDDRIELIGAYGEDPLGLGLVFSTRFVPSVVEIITPLNYLDTLSSNTSVLLPFATSDLPDSIVAQLPIAPDSFRIRTNISRMDLVDAWGTLQLPEANYEVLRQKRVETANFRIEAKVLFLGWQDITELISSLFIGQDLPTDTLISYRFLSNEAHEPVLTCAMDSTGENIINAQFRSTLLTTSISETDQVATSMTVFPNPATDRINFKMEKMLTGRYSFQLFNASGLLVKEEKFFMSGTALTTGMDISGLPSGTYWGLLKNTDSGAILTKPGLLIKQ